MYAHVIHVTIKDLAEAKKGLEESVIPMIKDAPGFSGAYFVALDDGHGVSIAVFDTEEHARSAAPPADASSPGVAFDRIEFGEVVGSA